MKNFFYFLLLLPLLSYSKFYKGAITFNDDSKKVGLIEIPEATDQKIKFKSSDDAKAEKFEIDLVKGFEYVTPKNGTMYFEAMILATPAIFNTAKLNIDKKKTWVLVIKKSKITLYAFSEGWSNGYGVAPGATSSTPYTKYYLKKPNTEYAIYLNMILGNGGFTIVMNNFNELKKTAKIIFEKDCPEILEKINKEDFKKNGLTRIVDLYDEYCGK